MAERLVAADASPLIGLAAAEAFDLLRQLFGTITLTSAVHAEVMAGGERPGARELSAAILDAWIYVSSSDLSNEQFPELGAGEASVLALALTFDGERLLLMDDLLGRARAHSEGIAVTGLAGILLAAKQAKLIERVQPFLERAARRGFRVSDEIIEAILEQAGE
jgi:predicted nucleic acid-binding protein